MEGHRQRAHKVEEEGREAILEGYEGKDVRITSIRIEPGYPLYTSVRGASEGY
jgi:hypothetical protein